jgi:hypothetical protein
MPTVPCATPSVTGAAAETCDGAAVPQALQKFTPCAISVPQPMQYI